MRKILFNFLLTFVQICNAAPASQVDHSQIGYIVFVKINKDNRAAIQYIDRFGITQLVNFGKRDTVEVKSSETINVINLDSSQPILYRFNVNDTIYVKKDEHGKQVFYSRDQEKNAQLKYMATYSKLMSIFSKSSQLPDVDGGKAELLRRIDSLEFKHRTLSQQFMLEEEANITYIQHFNYLSSRKEPSPAEVGKLAEMISKSKFTYLISFRSITNFYLTYLLKKKQNNIHSIVAILDKEYESCARNLLLFQLMNDPKIRLSNDFISKYLSKITDSSFNNYISKNNDLQVNRLHYKAVDDALLDVSGEISKFKDVISSYTGKVIYIDIWASWCEPCLAQMEQSKTLSQEFKKVQFLYISTDKNRSAWENKVKEISLPMTNCFLFINSFDTKFLKQFNVKSIPRYIIIDKRGKIVNQDAPRPTDNKLKNILATLLNEK